MQRLGGAGPRAFVAEDALRSVFPFAGFLVDLHVHGADPQTLPAMDALLLIAVDAQQGKIAHRFEEHRDRTQILAERPVVLAREGKRNARRIVKRVSGEEQPEHDLLQVRNFHQEQSRHQRQRQGEHDIAQHAQLFLSRLLRLLVTAAHSTARGMASIRKRGSSYLIVVSMGYDYNGKRINPRQKTVHPPEELTPRQVEKWLNEQAVLFERECRHTPQPVQQLTLAKYIDLWLADIAPGKLAKSTIRRDRQDIERILPALGHYKLTELRPEHFRSFYAELRKVIRPDTKKPLSEYTIEGVHATLCSILSDAVEGGFLSHNPAWRTYRYAGRKCEKKIADEETAQKIIAALEGESIKYETYFKLIIATGMRRGECCGLKWCDIDWEQRSIHICRNAVKVTDEEIFVKEPKTRAGDRYVYFSAEMESLLREYRQECAYITETYDQRQLTADDFLFRRQGAQLPMTPTTFTYRFKLILKKNGLPQELNVHSLRHTAASLMIAGGTDVATVAGILGHSQPSTTLDIYTHAFDKNKKAASAGLQGMLEI